MILLSYRSGGQKSKMDFARPKWKCQQNCVLFRSSRGKPFSSSIGCIHPITWGPCFYFQCQQQNIFKSLSDSGSASILTSPSWSNLLHPLPAFKDTCEYIGSTRIMQISLSILRSLSLITSTKSPLPHKVTRSILPSYFYSFF